MGSYRAPNRWRDGGVADGCRKRRPRQTKTHAGACMSNPYQHGAVQRFWEEHQFSIVALLGAVLCGVVWRLATNEPVKHLAEAFGITFLLALTVDRSLKGKLAREVARDVAPFAFGYGMPREFVDEILYARGLTLVRRNVELDFTFRTVSDHPEFLELETTTSFTLVNFSDEEQSYTHTHNVAIDQYARIKPCQITKASAEGKRDLSKEYSYDGNVPVTKQSQSPVLSFKEDVQVSPNGDAPANRLWSTAVQIVDASDSDVVYFQTPVIGMTARILSKPDDLDVGFIFGHRRNNQVKLTQPNCWRLDAACLHWGSISVWWTKRP
jgi:hypothetical protein